MEACELVRLLVNKAIIRESKRRGNPGYGQLKAMEARGGITSRGPFKGFKVHAVVNQAGLPLRAFVTKGNRFGSLFLPKLIEDLEAEFQGNQGFGR